MKFVRAILPLLLTTVLVYVLNKPMGSIPALGPLLDPIGGFWGNAESTDNNFNASLQSDKIQEDASVWFDDRMVPHITASNDYDLYFLQGYTHAYFRLWQMDLQTRAAAGRVSELQGEKAINYDREQRRKGMVYGAEQKLKAMEGDERTKIALDGYRDGVNQFIASLTMGNKPVEYKLMGFEPEEWTNIKTALLLMYMADDLTGDVHDIGLTYYLQNVLTQEQIDFFFPEKAPGSTPVIPVGTKFAEPSMTMPAMPNGKVWADIDFVKKPTDKSEEGKGSNNWAVSGSRTQSGKPILCNDPHLALNLPSLWFEVQLTAPGINVYGVSLPGAPGVVIGFNDNISWGFTNNYRDVKDYYAIQPVDENNYSFDEQTKPYSKRVEVIKVKGAADVNDTVNYTVHGPVIYDEHYKEPNGIKQHLALKWMALKESNELLSLYLLNRASNYEGYVNAIGYFHCPAQNFIYSDTKGDIALWGQGQYINKWKGQGKYIMDGSSSNTLWGDEIPVSENPHAYNPEKGYLSSANQNVSDTTYPYWYNGRFNELRAWRINEVLDTLQQVTVKDMFRLQSDDHSVLARMVLPYLLSNVEAGGKYFDILKDWDYNYSPDSEVPTVFQVWWHFLYRDIWKNTFKISPDGLLPLPERTVQIMLTENSRIPDLKQIITTSFSKAKDSLDKLAASSLQWYRVKNTSVNHLAKLAPFSYTDLHTGGWGNTVNAMKGNHGPSWRMVVEMTDVPQGYGIYPGGQSGNPGSKYYFSFLDKWAGGKYNELTFIPKATKPDDNVVKYTWSISKKNR